MPAVSSGGPAPLQDPIAQSQSGVLTPRWLDWFLRLDAQLGSIQTIVNQALGVNRFLLANQPTLGAGDAGYVGYVTDYAHLVYWDGAAWQWLDSDYPGRFEAWAIAPSTGWGLCDGSTYAYLSVGGASLTTANFTTPNLKGSAAYLKSAAAYTGTINAASGSTATGTTGTGTTGTGTTGTGVTGTGTSGDESSHTHAFSATSGGPSVAPNYSILNTDPTAPAGNGVHTHSVSGTTGAGSAHNHSVPSLSVPGLSVPGLSVPGLSIPALGVGTIDMANLGMPVYVRR